MKSSLKEETVITHHYLDVNILFGHFLFAKGDLIKLFWSKFILFFVG